MDMRIAGGGVKPTRLAKRLPVQQRKLVRGMMVASVVVFRSRTCCIFFASFIHFLYRFYAHLSLTFRRRPLLYTEYSRNWMPQHDPTCWFRSLKWNRAMQSLGDTRFFCCPFPTGKTLISDHPWPGKTAWWSCWKIRLIEEASEFWNCYWKYHASGLNYDNFCFSRVDVSDVTKEPWAIWICRLQTGQGLQRQVRKNRRWGR